jgi:hypothetical protein
MKRIAATFAIMVFAAASAPAFADPTGDIKAAYGKLMATKSYRTSMTMANGTTANGTAVNPDRYDMTVNGMEMIIIGDASYTHVGGKWQKAVDAGASVSPAQQYATLKPGAVVRDLGTRVVGGTPLHAYSVQRDATALSVTMFIDSHGLPVRIEVPTHAGTAVLRFYDFNAPISITAPI